jgi:hypothetical protein
MDLRNLNPDVRRAMVELFVRGFSADEFRRLVADVNPALIPELPGESCPPATLIAHGVDLLLRHGHTDPQFFNRWIELRPAHRSEILSIAEGMRRPSPRPAVTEPITLSATAAAPALVSTAASADQNFDVWIFLAFVLLLVVVVLLFLALHDSPFRVEYTIAAFLIAVAFVLVLLRHYIAALFALAAGLLVMFWIGRRVDRQAAIART